MYQPMHHVAVTPRRTPDDLRTVAELDDRIGVLSAYFATGPNSPDARALRDKLTVLCERARSWRARDRRALSHAADRLLQRVRQPAATSSTAALAVYWRLDAGESVELALPSAVGCTATVAAHAQLGPLCEAIQAGRPAGVLHVDDDLGALYEIAGAAPVPPRLLARSAMRMRDAALEHGRRHGWDLLLVTGRGEGVDQILGIGSDEPPTVIDGRPTVAMTSPAWRATAACAIASERRRRASRELAALLDQAHHGDGAAICDLESVRGAIPGGRVRKLLVATPYRPPGPAVGVAPWPQATEALLHAAALGDVAVKVAPAGPRPLDAPLIVAQLDRFDERPARDLRAS
ncbi:MAG TPA: hypothetical protein VFG42_01265 [Baekduia sp.]|uniref:hypothetical protein n=1 Tax=Baekduia sp. TaxID=2600305 RepID=UPI002D7A0D53|nr:hypothetical protein [Baekduia sp.]HET6505391.1 hypothetical protein [Baekduia sp.]